MTELKMVMENIMNISASFIMIEKTQYPIMNHTLSNFTKKKMDIYFSNFIDTMKKTINIIGTKFIPK
jgi:hypothetical protein